MRHKGTKDMTSEEKNHRSDAELGVSCWECSDCTIVWTTPLRCPLPGGGSIPASSRCPRCGSDEVKKCSLARYQAVETETMEGGAAHGSHPCLPWRSDEQLKAAGYVVRFRRDRDQRDQRGQRWLDVVLARARAGASIRQCFEDAETVGEMFALKFVEFVDNADEQERRRQIRLDVSPFGTVYDATTGAWRRATKEEKDLAAWQPLPGGVAVDALGRVAVDGRVVGCAGAQQQPLTCRVVTCIKCGGDGNLGDGGLECPMCAGTGSTCETHARAASLCADDDGSRPT